MIKYYKLFDLINRREMKKTDLLKIMSSPTLAKLSKGETVKTDIIDRICLFLECQPGDIMECIKDEFCTNMTKEQTEFEVLSYNDEITNEPIEIVRNKPKQ